MSNTRDDLKKILMAGIDAIGGQADKSHDFIEHILQNVQIPDQFKDTIEDLASKGESMLKNSGLMDAVGGLLGGNRQQSAPEAAPAAPAANNGAHDMVMAALEQLDHAQLTQVLDKAASLIASLAGET